MHDDVACVMTWQSPTWRTLGDDASRGSTVLLFLMTGSGNTCSGETRSRAAEWWPQQRPAGAWVGASSQQPTAAWVGASSLYAVVRVHRARKRLKIDPQIVCVEVAIAAHVLEGTLVRLRTLGRLAEQ